MKNYLCINGKTIELTEEQVKILAKDTETKISIENDTFKVGKYEFIVLKKDDEGAVHALLKNSLYDSEFGENNNDFRESIVKKKLEEFADEIEKILGKGALLEHTVDLTADDGLKDYGTTTSKMSLLTADMYREHVYKIDEHKLDDWWWLATPCSTKTHDWNTAVKCVAPSGNIGINIYGDDFGVRPFCIFNSNIFVSCEN